MFNLGISLDNSSKSPLYMQLYDYIVSEIRLGNLSNGQKMPSKRKLSDNLNISVNTVDTAYQMLCSEGYIKSIAKKGFYVCELEQFNQTSLSKSSLEVKPKQNDYMFDMTTSGLDTSLFPYKIWGRIQRETLSYGDMLLNHGERKGDEILRVELAKYLHEYRSVNCSPHEIIIGAGMEYLVSLLANLLEDSVFGVENPGYEKVRKIINNCGKQTRFISVDNEGVVLNEVEKSDCNVLYLTPSHQFPTGGAIPMSKRLLLLSWANASDNRYIIEDDYDSEFRFDRKPIASLQGLDTEQKVIYLGTFSRCLAPSIRIAYMVLPSPLMKKFDLLYGSYSSTVSRFEQYTLAKFIQNGHFSRHLSRLRVAYRNRRDKIVDTFVGELSKQNISFYGEHTGLHMVIGFKNIQSELEICEKAKQQGILIRGLSEYYMTNKQKCPKNRIVLGYGALSEQQLIDCLERFKLILGQSER